MTETAGGTRVDASLTCSRFVAQNISPDYDDRDAAGHRPYVSVTAELSCAIE